MAPRFTNVLAVALAGCQLAFAQNPDDTAEVHPKLTTYKCTKAGGCVAQDTSVVIDWNYHWYHTADWLSCTTSSGAVNTTLCPDQATCAKNCFVQGDTNYTDNGVTTSGDTLTMYQYTKNSDGAYQNASPRLYLLGSDGNYEMLQLNGNELTFTVDLSQLPCGENGALYLGEMDKTGGRSEYNKGGANYGGGYCDAQCPVQNWRNGTINTSGASYCCNEMDILEANSKAISFTPHPCSSSDCDRNGCGFNPYSQGYKNYYGPGGTVDTSKPFTVVTQFNTDDGTTTGTLVSITRKYLQNGVVVASANTGGDTLTSEMCNALDNTAAAFGGLATSGKALARGMVLTFAIWNDVTGYMNWLDTGNNGPCSLTEGNPALIIQNNPTTHVVFSGIRWGDIGSTFSSGGGAGTTTSKAGTTLTTSKASTVTSSSKTVVTTKVSTTSSAAVPAQTHYGQCGGKEWTGPKTCVSPYKCVVSNEFYSQCL
ncbi:carbohydrate-binding module family 1 protein [Karstenula rhodostoma CBS 690.94]|uniref:Glucanase n=1 Tax=Karstenula rhodostoma CBS 690.94 TaxID=1392251 RepID=A0A9P4P5S1_9PLEO|nr:carbohydrate-binding module family 1 protein [Karstenula rhodostoma CBS 690.94]